MCEIPLTVSVSLEMTAGCALAACNVARYSES